MVVDTVEPAQVTISNQVVDTPLIRAKNFVDQKSSQLVTDRSNSSGLQCLSRPCWLTCEEDYVWRRREDGHALHGCLLGVKMSSFLYILLCTTKTGKKRRDCSVYRMSVFTIACFANRKYASRLSTFYVCTLDILL